LLFYRSSGFQNPEVICFRISKSEKALNMMQGSSLASRSSGFQNPEVICFRISKSEKALI
jgi:hypothetical protein